jgi:hypothetical protein
MLDYSLKSCNCVFSLKGVISVLLGSRKIWQFSQELQVLEWEMEENEDTFLVALKFSSEENAEFVI